MAKQPGGTRRAEARLRRAIGRPPAARPVRFRGLIAVAAVAVLASSCASPALRFDRAAGRLGFERDTIGGGGFEHAVFRRPDSGAPGPACPGPLHLYLGDDGRPWLAGNRVARDPTASGAVVLGLMGMDPGPTVLLGRPCYHGAGPASACSPLVWTHRRYGEEVVASLAAAARRLVEERGANGLVLFGHSGGGALAMLLAERLAETRAVVTVAAPLDVAAWAELHGYTPLRGSLDPAARPPLPAAVGQLHLAGGRDRVVPPELVRAAVRSRPGSEVRVVEAADHACCWRDVWPEVLAWVEKAAGAPRVVGW